MAEVCRFSGALFHVHAPTEGHLDAFFKTLLEDIDKALESAQARHPQCEVIRPEEEDGSAD